MKRETEMGRRGRWWCLPLVTAISKACKCCWKRFYLNLSRKSWNCVLNKWKNKKHKLTCRGDDNFLCICMKCFTKLLTYSLLSVLIHKLSCRMLPWCTLLTPNAYYIFLCTLQILEETFIKTFYRWFRQLSVSCITKLCWRTHNTYTHQMQENSCEMFVWRFVLEQMTMA